MEGTDDGAEEEQIPLYIQQLFQRLDNIEQRNEQREQRSEQRYHEQQVFNQYVQQSLEELRQRRSGRSSRANSEIVQADQFSEIPFEESKSNGNEVVGLEPVVTAIEQREQQYIDPDLLQTRIENAVREGVMNATLALKSEDERPVGTHQRLTLQEALQEIERNGSSEVTVAAEKDPKKYGIKLSVITLDGFLVFLEKIAEFEKMNRNRPIPSVYALLDGRAKELIRHTLKEIKPNVYPSQIECNDASITDLIAAARRHFRPFDVMQFNKMLASSCESYKVSMEKLENFRKVDEDLCILETKFLQRYEFLEEAAKQNDLRDSIPLITTKRGGSLAEWFSLIPYCMRDTFRRLLRTENFTSVQLFLSEFFKIWKITRELHEKYNQFKSRFKFSSDKDNKKVKELKHVDDVNEYCDEEEIIDDELCVLKHEEDLLATVEAQKSAPCFREMMQEGGCKDKSCKFSHDKAILIDALKVMNTKMGMVVMPRPSLTTPPQRRFGGNPGQLKRNPGDVKRPGDVRILTRDQLDIEEDQQGDDNPLDDL